jgi:DNA polymerase-1
MGKLVIIDGHAILHRAFHALPPLTNRNGEPINAVYGLTSMLLRVIRDFKPTYLAVCFDEKEKTFRHEALESYQAQRPKMADELSSQIQKAKDVVSAFNIPIFSKPGYEADDVIGTLAEKTKEEVVIITGDKDILQLVNKRIKVFLPIKGLSEGKLMGEEEVKIKMGVTPELIPDYKALVGDPSDNYPGVPGIGPKTAINLLDEFGSVGGVYKNLKKIPEKTREKLVQGEESAQLSHKLATLVIDLPLDFKLEEADKWDIDSPKVMEEFTKLGFKTLTERVKKVGRELDQEKQGSLF